MSHRELSNQNFADLLDGAPDAIVIVDERGTIEFANQRTEQLFGWSRAELLGEPIEKLISQQLRASHVDTRSRYAASPTTRPMGSGRDLLAQRRDGSEFPVEISLSPLKTDSGLLVSSIIRDVTDRKRLELDARRTADHLRSAVESIQDSFALFDAGDRLVLCNSTYREVFGRALEGPIAGRGYREILESTLADGMLDPGSEPAPMFRERWLDYLARLGAPIDVTTSAQRTLRIAERRTPEGGLVVLVSDLTRDAQREAELLRMRRLAEAASTAKSEFLASMSHELRTPLNAVLGFAQLLQRDKKQPLGERQRTMVEHVIKGGEHLLRLIDDVLDLSRIEAGGVTISTEAVSVSDVLEEVRNALDPLAARAGIGLVVEASVGPMEISADRTRFAQILMNYGSNAIKYGQPGGTVRFSAVSVGGDVRVTVADDGLGIPHEMQDRIFQPFQRLGQEAGPIEGTGIGLAITKRLAELMGGEVGFHSVPECGSKFWVDLPRHAGESPDARIVASRAEAASSLDDGEAGRVTVVYIEDNPANVAFMRELLAEFERVELLVAVNAEVGIELVQRVHPNVVIMDINLPGMSGFDATRWLREQPDTRDIPIIGLSAAAMPRDRKLAEEAGLFRYLTKPVSVEALVAALEEVLDHHLAESPPN